MLRLHNPFSREEKEPRAKRAETRSSQQRRERLLSESAIDRDSAERNYYESPRSSQHVEPAGGEQSLPCDFLEAKEAFDTVIARLKQQSPLQESTLWELVAANQRMLDAASVSRGRRRRLPSTRYQPGRLTAGRAVHLPQPS
jgi:hypothetical protein